MKRQYDQIAKLEALAAPGSGATDGERAAALNLIERLQNIVDPPAVPRAAPRTRITNLAEQIALYARSLGLTLRTSYEDPAWFTIFITFDEAKGYAKIPLRAIHADDFDAIASILDKFADENLIKALA